MTKIEEKSNDADIVKIYKNTFNETGIKYTPNKDVVQKSREVFTMLKNEQEDYFEAKIKRPVYLNEFEYAILEQNTLNENPTSKGL